MEKKKKFKKRIIRNKNKINNGITFVCEGVGKVTFLTMDHCFSAIILLTITNLSIIIMNKLFDFFFFF